MTKAILDGQQVDNIYQVNVNQEFGISVLPIDNITRRRLGHVVWGNWTWQVNVTLYRLVKYNQPGLLLIGNNSFPPIINTEAGTITVNNLKINDTGMYVLNIHLVSSNNEYVITLTSNGILVNNDSSKLNM